MKALYTGKDEVYCGFVFRHLETYDIEHVKQKSPYIWIRVNGEVEVPYTLEGLYDIWHRVKNAK